MNSADAMAGGRISKVKVRYDEGGVLLLDQEFCYKDKTRMSGRKVPKMKVRYDEGEALFLEKGFRFKDKTRKSNSEGTKGKMAKICLSDPAVVKRLDNTEIKLAGLPSTPEYRKKGSSPEVVKRIRIDEVQQYFTRCKAEERSQQGILSSRYEVRLERICIPYVGDPRTECRERPSSLERNTVQALVLKPKTIKQVLHNVAVHSQFNEGHADDLFGQSKGQAGYGPLKKQKSYWEGRLISKEESSGDESSLSSKSDLVRGRSPARWSLACQPVSSKAAERSDTPERSRWQNLSPVVLHTERQRAAFQLRKLKERSKTEVNPRRTGAAEQSLNKGRRLWYEESAVANKVEKGFGEKEKSFGEMVAQVKRSTDEGREDTPDSDCEKYFSDD